VIHTKVAKFYYLHQTLINTVGLAEVNYSKVSFIKVWNFCKNNGIWKINHKKIMVISTHWHTLYLELQLFMFQKLRDS